MLCLLNAFAGMIKPIFMLVWNAEHNDRAGDDISSVSFGGLDSEDTGVVPAVLAAFHQVQSAVASNVTSA